MKNRPITLAERTQWAAIAHLAALQAIGQSEALTNQADRNLAFHGGTSLHLSWNSPRFSEDLDFLLSANAKARLGKEMDEVIARMREQLLLVDPEFTLVLKDKSTERMGNFSVSLSKPGVLGTVMVKLEFWVVPPTYLERYETALRTPAVPVNLGGATIRVDSMLPAATLESAFYDKLTAFATRPHLKWRDLFDYWWLDRAGATEWLSKDNPTVCTRLMSHLSAYETVDKLSPDQALLRFAKSLEDVDTVVAAAERDLKPFLPPHVWAQVWPKQVREMVETAVRGCHYMVGRLQSWGYSVPPEDQPDLGPNHLDELMKKQTPRRNRMH
jgi:predicted nucleotidyltransferase component of viral defense system